MNREQDHPQTGERVSKDSFCGKVRGEAGEGEVVAQDLTIETRGGAGGLTRGG